MFSDSDSLFLLRALDLAQLAGNQTSPNPWVGAVVVANGHIIGEGFHAKAGLPHAEPMAISSVEDSYLLRESTLYVTLEPCNHFGKTPPCTELIIQSQIPRVVIGCQDPNPQVNGSGILRLREAGIEVILAPDPRPFQHLIRYFSWAHSTQSAWVTLKWAENQLRYIGDTHDRIQISHLPSSVLVHKLRADLSAILVGANTILTDSPQLNIRLVSGNNPVKIVLDPQEIIPPSHPFFKLPGKMLHLTLKNLPESCFQDTRQLLQWIYQEHALNAVLVEGGGFILNWFIQQQSWNEIYRIQSQSDYPKISQPVLAPDISSLPEPTQITEFQEDKVFYYI
jgi:diaminohydroxyphosphoribosylaminopyrimidine deaminase / 5-amino-6-(5-phosphoribosylamino)uracil reductase